LWNEATPINGSGETIAIAGRSNIFLSDIATFRGTWDLPPNSPAVIIPPIGSDPGTGNSDDLAENTLDVEWAGAVAPEASVVLVTSAPVGSTGGEFVSAIYIVESMTPTPSIMSYSYGECELGLGSSGNSAYNTLWSTAASEGIAVFVASGDSGSAMCDGGNAAPYFAVYGLMVNGDASSPYDTAVGGTDLNWYSNPSKYWSSSNNSTTGANALGYIPEVPWNQTCINPIFVAAQNAAIGKNYSAPEICYDIANGIITSSTEEAFLMSLVNAAGGGGGASNCTRTATTGSGTLCSGGYGKPSWQTGVTGIPADNARDLPDVSFFASFEMLGSAYLIYVNSGWLEVGGTSVASPAMAGVMALINQKAGAPQGNPNTELYALAGKQTYSGCSAESVTTSSSCYFNDIDTGTNAVPCDFTTGINCIDNYNGYGELAGWSAGAGYDLATGLGSLNVANVVNAWSPTTMLKPTVAVTTPAIGRITPVESLAVTVTVSGGTGNPTPTGSVTLTSGSYSSAATTLSGGTATITIPAGSLPVGTDTLIASYTPDSASSSTYWSAMGSTSVGVITPGSHSTTVEITLSASSIPVSASLSVQVIVPGFLLLSGYQCPTGAVELTSGSYSSGWQAIGNCKLLVGSWSIFTVPPYSLSVGTDTLTVSYSGDPTFASCSGGASETVTGLPPTITVTPSSSSVTTAQSLSVAATVSGGTGNPTPTGTVTLTSGSYSSGAQTLSNGSYTFTVPAGSLSVGTDTLTVSYGGDTNYAAGTGTASVTVTALPTPTVTVTPAVSTLSAGTSLSVTAKVTGSGATPTGTVTLTSGSYSSGAQALASGSYTFTIPANSLSVGTDTLTVSYSGDTNYAAGTGTATVTVTPSYSLTATTPAAVAPGGTGSSTVTVSSTSGYAGTVTLTCALTSSPTGATDLPTCSTSGSSTVTLSSSTTSGTVTFTVSTTAASSSQLVWPKLGKGKEWGWGGAAAGWLLALLVFFGIPARRRRWQLLLAFLVVMAALGGLAGCGGGGGGASSPPPSVPGTTAGQYTFTVTGTGNPALTPTPTTTFILTVS
jgi:hypothetical protein